MEIWDVYDRERRKTGRKVIRGEKLGDGEYHLVVHIWIMNSNGEFLIQKRSPYVKRLPNLWAMTGGAAVEGDDSASACIRELKEETGIAADMEHAEVVLTIVREGDICDVWLIHQDVNLGACILQEEEVSCLKWASAEEIRQMIDRQEFAPYFYFEDLLAKTMLKIPESL